jgi:hypothetical protein
MATADFTINATAHSTLGYDAEHDEVLTLALENPGLDVERVRFSVTQTSEDADDLTFSPTSGGFGVPATPSGSVTVTMPSSGVQTWKITCEVNEGRDSNGRTNRDYTRSRIVAIRSPNLSLRKWIPGEVTEYHVKGWTADQNQSVDLLDTYGLGDIGFPWHNGIEFPTDGTYSITQEIAETGITPVEANLKAQSAAVGDTEDGALLRLAGGDPGDPANRAGNVAVELGAAVSTTTAALSVETEESPIMQLLQYIGRAAVRAGGSLVLQLYSATTVRMETALRSLVLDDSGTLTASFLTRFTQGSGQRVMTPGQNNSISGAIDLDFDVFERWSFGLSGNVTFNAPTNVVHGARYTIRVTQNAPGSRTATWNSVFKFGALNGTLSTATGAIDIFVFEGGDSGEMHCILAAKGVHA